MERYTVRYRATDDSGWTALVVEDDRRAAYIFCGERLQAYLAPGDGDAPGRLAALLARRASVARVPAAPPHTLADLRRYIAAPFVLPAGDAAGVFSAAL